MPLLDIQTVEQIQQDRYNPKHDLYLSSRGTQFKMPNTPLALFAMQPGEQLEQEVYYSTPDIYSSNGASQFRVPLTPRFLKTTGEIDEHIHNDFSHKSADKNASLNISPQISLANLERGAPSVVQISRANHANLLLVNGLSTPRPHRLSLDQLTPLPAVDEEFTSPQPNSPSIDELTKPLPLVKEDLSFQLSALLPRRIMGFSLVGGGVMMGGIALIFILVQFLHVEQDISYLIQAVTAIETNFFLNRFTNWKDRTGSLFAQWLKFHSTSIFTFLLNQGLFAVLTRLGVSYLVVTVLGAGLAAIINYVTNDRFVFNGQDISIRETLRVPAIQPVGNLPRVGIVIPVRNTQRTIRCCVESVLRQDYAGNIDIFIVGNSPEQDATWQALGDLQNLPTIHCLQIVRPSNIAGRDANMKRYKGSQEALRHGAEIVAFLDSQIEAPISWLSTAVRLLLEHGTDGIAGISCHHPQDRTLSGCYQDGSYFAEWPRYGSGFVLRLRNFGQARGLPITANLLLTREALLHVRAIFPK